MMNLIQALGETPQAAVPNGQGKTTPGAGEFGLLVQSAGLKVAKPQDTPGAGSTAALATTTDASKELALAPDGTVQLDTLATPKDGASQQQSGTPTAVADQRTVAVPGSFEAPQIPGETALATDVSAPSGNTGLVVVPPSVPGSTAGVPSGKVILPTANIISTGPPTNPIQTAVIAPVVNEQGATTAGPTAQVPVQTVPMSAAQVAETPALAVATSPTAAASAVAPETLPQAKVIPAASVPLTDTQKGTVAATVPSTSTPVTATSQLPAAPTPAAPQPAIVSVSTQATQGTILPTAGTTQTAPEIDAPTGPVTTAPPAVPAQTRLDATPVRQAAAALVPSQPGAEPLAAQQSVAKAATATVTQVQPATAAATKPIPVAANPIPAPQTAAPVTAAAAAPAPLSVETATTQTLSVAPTLSTPAPQPMRASGPRVEPAASTLTSAATAVVSETEADADTVETLKAAAPVSLAKTTVPTHLGTQPQPTFLTALNANAEPILVDPAEAPRLEVLQALQTETRPITQASVTATTTTQTKPTKPFAEALVSQVRAVEVSDGRTTVNLHPRGLGAIEIEVIGDKDLASKVVVRVDNPAVLQVLRDDRQMLAQAIGIADSTVMEFENQNSNAQTDQQAKNNNTSSDLGQVSASDDPTPEHTDVIANGNLNILT